MDGGGVGEIVPKDSDDVLEEVTLVKDVDLAGNASLGISIDRVRNRLLVAVADLLGNRYSALAAYDLSTWRRLFLAELSAHGKSAFFFFMLCVSRRQFFNRRRLTQLNRCQWTGLYIGMWEECICTRSFFKLT